MILGIIFCGIIEYSEYVKAIFLSVTQSFQKKMQQQNTQTNSSLDRQLCILWISKRKEEKSCSDRAICLSGGHWIWYFLTGNYLQILQQAIVYTFVKFEINKIALYMCVLVTYHENSRLSY